MTTHPVHVVANGQRVRVGTATQEADGSFLLTLVASIGPAEATSRAAGASSGGGGISHGPRLPNFGRSAGQAVEGASMRDLTFYESVLAKNVEDESKARWRDQNQATLDAIRAEIHRQKGGEGYTPPQTRLPQDDEDGIPFN